MTEMTAIMLLLTALLLLIGVILIRIVWDTGYDAGWEKGVKDVIGMLSDDCIRALAEEVVRDPEQQMQMMVDCAWKRPETADPRQITLEDIYEEEADKADK